MIYWAGTCFETSSCQAMTVKESKPPLDANSYVWRPWTFPPSKFPKLSLVVTLAIVAIWRWHHLGPVENCESQRTFHRQGLHLASQ